MRSMTQLLGFVLKLRNLGISDHGLLREISPSLAGSIYTGDGHSRIHEDISVYRLAVKFSLETASLPSSPPPQVKNYEGPVAIGVSNPYILPWAMRGLLEEKSVKTEFQAEAQELLRLFDEWEPATKSLKNVKWRLEAVKSKL